MTCKNEEMNKAGTGKQSTYPRSCQECGLGGPCRRNIVGDPASTIEERYYMSYARLANKPDKTQYAVIHTDSIYHEGDERSRANPGHGYPAYTEQVEKIKIFSDKQTMIDWISSRGKYDTYTAIKFEKLTVNTSIEVV